MEPTSLFAGLEQPAHRIAKATGSYRLTDADHRALRGITNRHTLYEAAITRPDGAKALLAFCGRHSTRGLIDALRERSGAVWTFCGMADDEGFASQTGGVLVADNGSRVEWTGRTQRDSIMMGPEHRLVYVKDAVNE